MSGFTFPMKRWQKGEFYTRHTDIREELLKLQAKGGSVILPISLANVIHDYLISKGETANSQEKARNSAYMFACFCNEFYLQCKSWKLRDEFFVHNKRWEEYMIGREAKKTGIRILKEMNLIVDHGRRILRNGNKQQGIPPFKPTIYEINLEALKMLTEQAKSFTSEKWIKDQEEEKEKRYHAVPPIKNEQYGGLELLIEEYE